MGEKLKIVIGTIIFFSVLHGCLLYNDYHANHTPKAGNIIENNIELPSYEEVFTRTNTK